MRDSEVDIWRGMAACTQAQGAWQNAKGRQYETLIKDKITAYLQAKGLLRILKGNVMDLFSDWQLIFGSDPDIEVKDAQGEIQAVVEIK